MEAMQNPIRVRPADVLRIAGEASRDPRTVMRILNGGGTPMSRNGVIAAAERLGISLPPQLLEEPTRLRAT
jgi:hypothetical protein